MLQALKEIYEKMVELKSCKVEVSDLSSEELKEANKLLKDIHELDSTFSQILINEETIRKLYSENVEGEYGK